MPTMHPTGPTVDAALAPLSPEAFDALRERYSEVRARVAGAARRSGRGPDSVVLVAVTKSAGPEDIRALADLGHQDFGENRVPQMSQRVAMLAEYVERVAVLRETRAARVPGAVGPVTPIRWHMIGHLQRNKAKKAAEVSRLIHSVDSLRLAEELQQIALKLDRTIEVLVQVNCSGESQKFGCPLAATPSLVEQIGTMLNIRVRGLMTMAALGESAEEARPAFRRCRELWEDLRRVLPSDARFDLLSMGMSGDYEVAIEEGANIVRVGSAIFGEGPPAPDDEGEDG